MCNGQLRSTGYAPPGGSGTPGRAGDEQVTGARTGLTRGAAATIDRGFIGRPLARWLRRRSERINGRRKERPPGAPPRAWTGRIPGSANSLYPTGRAVAVGDLWITFVIDRAAAGQAGVERFLNPQPGVSTTAQPYCHLAATHGFSPVISGTADADFLSVHYAFANPHIARPAEVKPILR